jgi:diguanylate cyclase
MGQRRWTRAYLAVSAVAAALSFLWPDLHTLWWGTLGLTSAAAVGLGTAVNRPARKLPWVLVGLALATFALGDVVYDVLTEAFGQIDPFPSLADAFYLATYPLFAGGLLVMVRARRGDRHSGALFDALIVTAACALFAWLYFIVPYVRAADMTLPEKLISVAYPLGDIAILSVLARLLAYGGSRNPALKLLVAGAGGLLLADVAYGTIQLNGTWAVGGPTDFGWILFYVCWGAAALHPSMRELTTPQVARQRQLTVSSLVVLSALALVAPGLLVWRSLTNSHDPDTAVISCVAALEFMLVLGRLISMARSQWRDQALHDALTGLANRALFKDRVDHALSRRKSVRQDVGVLLLDVDDFKYVNDTLGHGAGDELLVQLAARIVGCLDEGDTAARLGGDEFGICIESGGDPANLALVAQRLLDAMLLPFRLDGHDVNVRVSIGVTGAGRQLAVAGDMLREADLALYAAKNAGKASFCFFEPSLHQAVVTRLERRAAFEQAIERGELRLHYQPVVTLDGQWLVGAEALVRWEHPTEGLVPPAEFIPLAEESGLVIPMGQWVLEQACADLAQWRQEPGFSDRPFRLSVNVSARQLQSPDFLACVDAVIERYQVPPAALMLEITESLLLQESLEVMVRLDALRDRGVLLALDDFGTGYSSLSYLRRFPIQVLKIDRSFVRGMDGDGERQSILKAISALAGSLGLQVVAEGIEQDSEAVQLLDMGFQYGQGYLFGKPGPAETLLGRLRSRKAEAA